LFAYDPKRTSWRLNNFRSRGLSIAVSKQIFAWSNRPVNIGGRIVGWGAAVADEGSARAQSLHTLAARSRRNDFEGERKTT
jgi:hypothetical protein